MVSNNAVNLQVIIVFLALLRQEHIERLLLDLPELGVVDRAAVEELLRLGDLVGGSAVGRHIADVLVE